MADTTIRLSGTYDSIEAYRILEEIREIGSDFEDIKEEAEAAVSTATSASTAATNASNAANTAANNAQTYAGNANNSATAAAGSASTASTAATNAANSETNASNKANAAAASATAAATSETNAGNSATAAAASATAAAASESIASGSATSAASNASAAASSATAAANSALAAEDAAERAESFTPEGFEARVEALETQVPINTANIAQNAGGISANSKRIGNIEKLLQGNLYDYQTDSDSAYTKSVPQGAMPYASLNSIGGKTLAWNQLVVMGNGTSVKNGITYTITSDGTVVINGTSTAIADSAITSFSTVPTIGHVYWLRGCPADSSASTYYINTNNGACYADGLRFTADSSTSRSIHVRVESGVTANNVTFKVQCTDLTLMFGEGNEPTLEECRTMFPAESYPYNAGTMLSAGVTEVVSKKVDNTEIAAYPIPAEIRNLEGYGWSAGTAYNYIDYERKVFVQNVGSVVLDGTQTAGYTRISTTSCRIAYEVPNVAPFNNTTEIDDKIISSYLPANRNDTTSAGEGTTDGAPGIHRRADGSSQILVSLGIESGITNSSDFNAYLGSHPLTVYYALATPQEIDISAYLTNDNLIEVESGGTLTFENQHGDDYRIDVPSAETFMVDLQEAI